MKGHLFQKLGAAHGRGFSKLLWVSSVTAPALLLLAVGCGRNNVKVYRVANGQNATAAQPAAQPPTGSSSSSSLPPGHPSISSTPGTTATAAPHLTWTTPAGWTEVAPSEMRVASFKVKGANGQQADVSVIPLPGMAGSDLANVNRWRGQVGLSAIAADAMQKAAQNIVAGGQPGLLYDIAGTNPESGNTERILGVIQHRPDGNSWFYKMTGDAKLVAQEKPAFIKFLKSLKFGAPAQTGAQPTVVNLSGSGMGGLTPASSAAKSDWQVPAGWQAVPPAQFLLAEFSITGANGVKADVNVAQLAGDGGGLLPNVNRWRQQIGLDAADPNRLDQLTTTMRAAGGTATVVDMSGTDVQTGKPVRLIGVILPVNGQTWFYKLMGDPAVVQAQKAAFLKFVQGAKY